MPADPRTSACSTALATPGLRAYLDLMAAEVGVRLPAEIPRDEAEELRLILQNLTGRGVLPTGGASEARSPELAG